MGITRKALRMSLLAVCGEKMNGPGTVALCKLVGTREDFFQQMRRFYLPGWAISKSRPESRSLLFTLV
jgi:hypothetical protein